MSVDLPGAFRLALPAYLALLLLLALLGGNNQRLLHEQDRLIDRKAQLATTVASLRLEASDVAGAGSVAAWARAAGLVPVPEGATAVLAARDRATLPQLPVPSLEVRTVWR